MTPTFHSAWDPAAALLRTTLQGTVTAADARAWSDGLARALARLPDGCRFRLLADLHGYEPADLDAHKAMREVIPRALAAHGLRPAVLDLFEERPEIPVTVERGRRCVACANVHHDRDKMADYERRIGTAAQRFFSDPRAAEAWLLGLPVDASR